MSDPCLASRMLLAARPLDGLEDDELGVLDAHLAECTRCSERDAALADAYSLLTDPVLEEGEPELPPAAWGRIAAGMREPATEPSAEPSAPDLAIALACTFCHDGLVKADATYCASCLAPHHADCFAAHGRCSAPGCAETHTVRPRLEVHLGDKRRRRGLGYGLAFVALIGAAALTAAVADLTADQKRLVEKRHEAEELQRQLALERERQVLRTRKTQHGPAYLGARLRDTTDGVEVAGVLPVSPADNAGLRGGDRLLTLEGEPIRDLAWLRQKLGEELAPFERVVFHVGFENEHGMDRERLVKVRLAEGGAPESFMVTASSGETYVPAKVLGTSGYQLLLGVHGQHSLLLGGYRASWDPEGESLGTASLVKQVAGSRETYHTFVANLWNANLGDLSDTHLGQTLWLQVQAPGPGSQVILPMDISGGRDLQFDADGAPILRTSDSADEDD